MVHVARMVVCILCWCLLACAFPDPPAGDAAGRPAVAAGDGLSLYVSKAGNDAWSGRLAEANAGRTDGPFATLERARDAIRALKTAGSLPAGGVTVWVRGGVYWRTASFALTSQDSGTATAPIVYRAYPGEAVRLSGGRPISGFAAVTSSTVLNRLDATARPHVLVANLPAQGVTDYGTYVARSWGSIKLAALEVFFQDRPMTLARWPNAGSWATIASTPDGQSGARFGYSGDRPLRWSNVADIWLHGYWTYYWADSDTKVGSIDTANRLITTTQPYGAYGYTVGNRWFAQNILEELDQPGEWYLDRATGNLYFWPPAPLDQGTVVVSVLSAPLITTSATSDVTFRELIVEHARGTGIVVSGGTRTEIADCTVRNLGNYAVSVQGGTNQGVRNCVVAGTGDGGIVLNGGDAAAGTTGGLYALNNAIHDYARWVRCYHPAVKLMGAGNRAANNLISHAPHTAILLEGGKHLVEYNEIHRVCLETQDSGAIYTNARYNNSRDHTVRYNYLHDLGLGNVSPNNYTATAAIYFDDAASYATVYGNLMVRCNVGILLGGGSYLRIENNVITESRVTVHADARGGPLRETYLVRNILHGGRFEFWHGVTPATLHAARNLIDFDPRFLDSPRGDYRLRDDSPAYALGFTRLPVALIGRR